MLSNEPELYEGDCLDILRLFPTGYFDLVFTSPPYEDCRTYGIDFKLKGQQWVDWARERFTECYRVSKGAVCWVVEGKTKNFRWSATPALLMADLHRAGVKLRKPPIFHRVGIPGSGGPDWLRNDYEFIVCATQGKLPWADNTAMGEPPKWAPGGDPSHRTKTGRRVHKLHTKADADGKREQGYNPPKISNPGNSIEQMYSASQVADLLEQHGDFSHHRVGGGQLGSMLAHENEAPFPESLAEFFIRSFCPPNGIVCDPFCGSGTTLAVAKKFGRQSVGIDVRASQIDLSQRRIAG